MVFKQHAIEAVRLTAESEAEHATRERRQAALLRHTQDFGSSIAGVTASLSGAADGMRQAAAAMSQSANAVHGEASDTSQSAAKSSHDLTAVAAAVEELIVSFSTIAQQVEVAATVARQAVQRAEASHGTMQGLSDATARIGDVVRLISDIASQTNLPPLMFRISRYIRCLKAISRGPYPWNTHDFAELAIRARRSRWCRCTPRPDRRKAHQPPHLPFQT